MTASTDGEKLLLLGTFDEYIHSAVFDTTSKSLRQGVSNKTSMKPTWVTQHPVHRDIVYSTAHTEGKVYAYRVIDESTGKLETISSVTTEGEAPTHLEVLRDASAVVVAHYRSGSTAHIPLLASGEFAKHPTITHYTPEPVAQELPHTRQGAPHAHQVLLGPNGAGEVYVPDFGYNEVLHLRCENDKWTAQAPFTGFQPGDAPRHSALHPKGTHLYTICELSSTLVIHSVSNPAKTLARISIVPSDVDKDAKPLGGAISILPSLTGNGPHLLLVTNRDLGEKGDAIALYRVEDDGSASALGFVEGVGKHLRGMAVDEDNRWICVAGRHGGGIVVYERSGEEGLEIKEVARLSNISQVIAPLWVRR